ncbi:MAG: hypothetical protein KDC98_24895 [Planctomycetes bacterium]|nr:hypothetical protein [Planctomycetota bacterium]
MSGPRIDLSKLRRRLRTQAKGTIFSMLDDALDLLSSAKLEQLMGRYMRLDELRSEAPAARVNTPNRLRVAVEEFVAASRHGDYFETFNVNSKNCTEYSNGTAAWIAELNRMLGRCVALSSRRRGAVDVLVAFELLFELMAQASTCELDIVFFADEGGYWEFGVDWSRVGASWLECLGLAKVDGQRRQRAAEVVERCGRICTGVGEELARAIRRYGVPPG